MFNRKKMIDVYIILGLLLAVASGYFIHLGGKRSADKRAEEIKKDIKLTKTEMLTAYQNLPSEIKTEFVSSLELSNNQLITKINSKKEIDKKEILMQFNEGVQEIQFGINASEKRINSLQKEIINSNAIIKFNELKVNAGFVLNENGYKIENHKFNYVNKNQSIRRTCQVYIRVFQEIENEFIELGFIMEDTPSKKNSNIHESQIYMVEKEKELRFVSQSLLLNSTRGSLPGVSRNHPISIDVLPMFESKAVSSVHLVFNTGELGWGENFEKSSQMIDTNPPTVINRLFSAYSGTLIVK